MPTLVCPRPGPHNSGPDCPLWDARERIALQRSIETDGATRPSMGALVWADFNRSYRRPEASPTRPIPVTTDSLVRPTDPSVQVESVAEKGVPNHV
jgi:hypothetical protein